MRLSLMIHVICSLCFVVSATREVPLSKHGCNETCGGVTIPYPFGIGSKCSANSSFTVICQNSTTPILSSINMELLNISLFGTVIIKQPVSPMSCFNTQSTGSLAMSLKGSPFTISGRYNLLAVLGCKNSVWLRANTTASSGCTPLCDVKSNDTSCNGVNCCQTTIPPRLKELHYIYKSTGAENDTFCGYAFPVDRKWFKKDYGRYNIDLLPNIANPFDAEFAYAPLVLEWEFGNLKGFSDVRCTYADDYCFGYPDEYGRRDSGNYDNKECRRRYLDSFCSFYPFDNSCPKSSYNREYDSYTKPGFEQFYIISYEIYGSSYSSDYEDKSSVKYCNCPEGYQGNPYLHGGCIDINECTSSIQKQYYCPDDYCKNLNGSFACQLPYSTRYTVRIASICIGSVLGGLILLIGACKSTKVTRKTIKANRRRKFFKRNGGILLEQQLSSADNGLEKAKLFSSKELTQATDNYNKNRILGQGGQGTVYKGMLTDGRIVAVKKSTKVEGNDTEVFINEVIILSQVNHRNVVKLLGCCLETEVPRLVYEFIPNGTIFQHIHEPNEEFPLTWEMRVRIAREVAGALAYLHSAASSPIYHRDIKSTSILLDDKYRAKVADFGTSKSISIDQTHLTTRVVGTFGYLDLEYFRSSQFTEKSDVYSFGLVMVELLTGEKAISAIRVEEGRGLAMYFLDSMEENQLLDILDARVLEEGKREEILAIAELARRCLQLNGRSRPTMKEVAVELEGIQMSKKGSNCLLNEDKSRDRHFAEVASFNYSSISDSMNLDTITRYSLDADRPLLDEP